MTHEDLCILARVVLGRPCRILRKSTGGTVVEVEGTITREQREALHHYSRDHGNLIVIGSER